MNFQRVTDAELLIGIEDRGETLGEVFVAGINLAREIGWEGIHQMPDAAARETIHDADAKALCCLGSFNEMGGGTLADALRVAIAVNGGEEAYRWWRGLMLSHTA